MKNILLAFLFILIYNISFGQKIQSDQSPLTIVNKRMKFYNQHNIKDFITLYADDVKIYTYPNKLLNQGVDNIRSIFEPKFEKKSIAVNIVNQMFNGSHVINHEIVTENGKETKYISIYEVKEGKIQSVRFGKELLVKTCLIYTRITDPSMIHFEHKA